MDSFRPCNSSPALQGLCEIKERFLASRGPTSGQARALYPAPYKQTSDFGEFPPFERRRDGAAHQQLRKMLGCVIQIVNALADELVVAARGGLFERRDACV